MLENVQFAPSRARFKVYLIDEVHMLSTHSFNALLKTLEEPPEHVKFLFATTDPQKLPVTILSRCLQFHLRNLGPSAIVKYVGPVLEQERIDCAADALWQIAIAAAGSMRDALTLVDQAISYCPDGIRAEAVVEMLGIPPRQQVFALLRAMAASDLRGVLAVSAELAGQVPDYTQILDGLLSSLHRLAMAQAFPDAIDNYQGDRQEILDLAGKFSAEDLQLFYQIGNRGRGELALSGDARAAFEMLLLRMLVFSPEPVAGGAGVGGTAKESEPGTETQAGARSKSDAVAESGPGNQVVAEPGQARGDQARLPPIGVETGSVPPEPSGAQPRPPPSCDPAEPPWELSSAPLTAVEPEHTAETAAATSVDPPVADALVANFEQDPNVQALLRNFSGKVLRESISAVQSRGGK